MAASSSIRVVKQFNYRGAIHTFSNRYYFGTHVPPDATHWTTLSDAVVTAEKAIYPTLAQGGAKIITTVGYAAGSEIPVFTKAYTTDGTLSPTGFAPAAGDTAALVRWSTADRSTKNHPIYCFNYFHGAGLTGIPSTNDAMFPAQKTALQTYANSWISGFSDGGTTVNRSRPQGNLCTGAFVEPLLTHRDLPR